LCGLSDTRCPECGEAFNWEQALEDCQRTRKPLFEYRWRSEPLRSLMQTWWLALRPWTLWRIVDLHDPPKTGPLIALVVVAALALTVLMAAPVVISEAVDYVLWMGRLKQHGTPYSQTNFNVWNIVQLALWSPAVSAMIAIVAIWCTATFAALMVFQQSMRRCRVRVVHVFRIWVYLVVLLSALMPLVSLPAAAIRGMAPPSFYNPGPSKLEALAILLLVGYAGYAMVVAYRRYLRMPHSIGVVVASQTIALLMTAIAWLMRIALW